MKRAEKYSIKKEFNNVADILLESFLIKNHGKNDDEIDKKEELLNLFSTLLQKYLEMRFLKSSADKLQLISFIDKLQLQKELLALENGQNKLPDLRLAAKRLGRKSQSAFENK